MGNSHPLTPGALEEEKRTVGEGTEPEETGSGDCTLYRAKKERQRRMIRQPVKVVESLVEVEVGECQY